MKPNAFVFAHCGIQCFDSTYEGLKPRPTRKRHRDAGSGFDSTYEGLKLVVSTARVPGNTRFDSTYEGLKRSTSDECSQEGARFDSTYEGLKLLLEDVDNAGDGGFDSTYEGLKLGPLIQSLARELKFRQYL